MIENYLGFRLMKNFAKYTLAFVATAIAFAANADHIEIVPLSGGEHPTMLGGYAMTPFNEPSGTSDCTSSASGGQVCFEDYYGNSVDLPAYDPWWWQYDGGSDPIDHGNIFVVHNHNWIDLILPANTRAFSLFVGASGRGNAWIQAHDDAGNSTPEVHFGVNRNDTSGYGVYATGCNSLTRITVEPWAWGFGYMSSNQGECTAVPEPTPIALLALGLLGIALTHRSRLKRQNMA